MQFLAAYSKVAKFLEEIVGTGCNFIIALLYDINVFILDASIMIKKSFVLIMLRVPISVTAWTYEHMCNEHMCYEHMCYSMDV